MTNQLISETVRNAIRNGVATEPGDDPFLRGYLTDGGTYILTQASGIQNDDDRPHDLVAFDNYGAVHPLSPALNPDLLAEARTVL